jgi:hypothetical protein
MKMQKIRIPSLKKRQAVKMIDRKDMIRIIKVVPSMPAPFEISQAVILLSGPKFPLFSGFLEFPVEFNELPLDW